jgi:hypothetical protein
MLICVALFLGRSFVEQSRNCKCCTPLWHTFEIGVTSTALALEHRPEGRAR